MKTRIYDHVCEICHEDAIPAYLFEGADKDIWVCETCYFRGKFEQEASA